MLVFFGADLDFQWGYPAGRGFKKRRPLCYRTGAGEALYSIMFSAKLEVGGLVSYYIAVVGAARCDPDLASLAEEVGAEIDTGGAVLRSLGKAGVRVWIRALPGCSGKRGGLVWDPPRKRSPGG